MDKKYMRFKNVPWGKRLLTAAVAIPVVLYLLKNKYTAYTALFCIGIIAIKEYVALRLKATNSIYTLYRNSVKETSKDTSTDSSITEDNQSLQRLKLILAWIALFGACVCDPNSTPGLFFFTIVVVCAFLLPVFYMLQYTWSALPEHQMALVYLWASAAIDICCVLHYLVPLAMASYILVAPIGFSMACTLFTISFLSDCGALFTGSLVGKTYFISKLSPKKSLEGLLGSFLWGYGAVLILFTLSTLIPYCQIPDLTPFEYFIASSFISIFGFFGDLAESSLKRAAGVKDSSALFGAHGGMLDRLDSLLPAIPPLVVFVSYKGLV